MADEAKAKVEVRDEEADAKAEGFVKMTKDGVVSFVHATTVEAHKAVGWVVSAFN